MKTIRFLAVVFAFGSLFACTDDGDDLVLKGERNATRINDVFGTNTIKWVDIYEYNYSTGGWNLAADNQTYTEGMDLSHVEGTYFYLNGIGTKTYAIGAAPTHQASGCQLSFTAYHDRHTFPAPPENRAKWARLSLDSL